MNDKLSLDELKAAFSDTMDNDFTIVSHCKAGYGLKIISYNPVIGKYSVKYAYAREGNKGFASADSLERALDIYNNITF